MCYQYGVMQGRLSPPEPSGLQAFPRNSWRREFPLAKQAGFSCIEWIHDSYDEGANPIFSEDGRTEMEKLKAEHGISTPAICADWFMEFPLIRCTDAQRIHREAHLHELILLAPLIGAKRIVLPFVDHSRMATEEEKQMVASILERALLPAEQNQVELHIEADLDPTALKEFLDMLPHPSIKVNWDSGNSSGLGYVASKEFAAYGNRIGSIHIKDRWRKPQGGVETRPLGAGSADFADVFRGIRSIGYKGGLTFQVARGAPGDEVNFLRAQIDFLKPFIDEG
jgi:L-ribulose-5-phosphate 3-epimerase